jgi:hypothetical protein
MRDPNAHFVEFMGKPNRVRSDVPRVTLNKKGILLMNRHAFLELGEPPAVKFYFDGNGSVIGLRAADIRVTNAFPVRKKDSHSNHVICAAPFCRHYGITPKCTILFTAIETDHTGLMKLDLRSAINITRGSS